MADDQLKIKVRGEDGYRTFSIRLKDRTFQGIEEVSRRTGRSRNELILFLDKKISKSFYGGVSRRRAYGAPRKVLTTF